MSVLSPPEAEDPAAELDLLIEEARQRARRRRILAAAAAITVAAALGGALLFFGGNGGGGAGATGPAGEDGAVGSRESSPPAAGEYRCPTSIRELKEAPPPGSGIPGCQVALAAELPEGWDRQGKSIVVYPPRSIGLFGASTIRFANFDFDKLRGQRLNPAASKLPDGGVLLTVMIGPSDATLVEDPGARREAFELEGLVLTVKRQTNGTLSEMDLQAIDTLIASFDPSQELCPCPRAPDISPPFLRTLDERAIEASRLKESARN